MNTFATQEVNLEQKMEELKQQLMEGKPKFEDFQMTHNTLRMIQKEFQRLLQWAAEDHREKEKEKEFQKLYHQVAGWNASDMMESLKRTGFSLRSTDIKGAFDRQGYRILELVRAGKRDEVFHAILRIFISGKKEFPEKLVEAFKPVYSEELFKVFLFSFLSGILGNEEKEVNDKRNQ
ncbi:MAG TPA: hypothetical protein ENO29_10505 [Candidatus Aminicenantes bacterium]|nr:MAG: hypothetical protein C0168_11295 [Candidatus Aminicenantes bacterium]HEK86764.1 hypothetical protein [Candidatus Aminicenantes bacterium]